MIRHSPTTPLHRSTFRSTDNEPSHHTPSYASDLLRESRQGSGCTVARQLDTRCVTPVNSSAPPPLTLERFPSWAPSIEAWNAHLEKWAHACRLMKNDKLPLVHQALASPLTDPELLQAAREELMITRTRKSHSIAYNDGMLALLRLRPDVPFVMSRSRLDDALPGKIGGYHGWSRAVRCLGLFVVKEKHPIADLRLNDKATPPSFLDSTAFFPPQAYTLFQSPAVGHIHLQHVQISNTALQYFKSDKKPATIPSLTLEGLGVDSAFFKQESDLFPQLRTLHLNLRPESKESVSAKIFEATANSLLDRTLDRLQIFVTPNQDPTTVLSLLKSIGAQRRQRSEAPHWGQFSLVLPEHERRLPAAVGQVIRDMVELGCPKAMLELGANNGQPGGGTPSPDGPASSGMLKLLFEPGSSHLHLRNLMVNDKVLDAIGMLPARTPLRSVTLEQMDIASPGLPESLAAFTGLQALDLNIVQKGPVTAAQFDELARALLTMPLQELQLKVMPGDDLLPVWCLLHSLQLERQKMKEAPPWKSLSLLLPTLALAMQARYHAAVAMMIGLGCPRLVLEVQSLDKDFRDSVQADQPLSPSRIALRERTQPLDLQIRLGHHALAHHVMAAWVKPLTWLSDNDPDTPELPHIPCLTGFSMQLSGSGVDVDELLLQRAALMSQASHVCASVVHQSPNLKTLEIQLGQPGDAAAPTDLNLDELMFALEGRPDLRLTVPTTGGHNPHVHRALAASRQVGQPSGPDTTDIAAPGS